MADINEVIRKNREFTQGYKFDDPFLNAETDESRHKPAPPAVKPPMTDGSDLVKLDRRLGEAAKSVVIRTMDARRSVRDYSDKPMTLSQLYAILFTTQSIQAMSPNGDETLRPVPSGGSKHAYETYLVIQNVEELKPGTYHYLPDANALEFLHPIDDIPKTLKGTFCGQPWVSGAAAAFYWAMVPYRLEWRYGVYAHKFGLIEAGHICQNAYLTCTDLNLGMCCSGTVAYDATNKLFGLDGKDEYVVYGALVGNPATAAGR